MDTSTLTDASVLRLMQLSSPALPIGAYAESRGLEAAVFAGAVATEADVAAWVAGTFRGSLCHVDVPILLASYVAFSAGREPEARRLARLLAAFRESAELRAEDRRLGSALMKLLRDLGAPAASGWVADPHVTYPTAFALSAAFFAIPAHVAALGYAYAFVEGQVAAALRLMPLGQTAGQRILGEVAATIPDGIAEAARISEHELGSNTHGLALGSARHETQYSRLFRS